MPKENDWRLTGQEAYMTGITLKKIRPAEYAKTLLKPELWHEHCEFCMEEINQHTKKPCYCTLDNYRFVCENCFSDFAESFRWNIEEA